VLFNDDVGPYHAVVQANPTEQERQVRFTIYVTDRATDAPLEGGAVRLQAVLAGAPGGAAGVDTSIPAEAGQPGFYDGPVQMSAYGDWTGILSVDGAEGNGKVAFPFPYPAPPGLDSPLWWLAALPVVVAGAVLFYFWRVLPPAAPDPAPDSEPAAAIEPEHHADGQQH
jgi:hypothetical protein